MLKTYDPIYDGWMTKEDDLIEKAEREAESLEVERLVMYCIVAGRIVYVKKGDVTFSLKRKDPSDYQDLYELQKHLEQTGSK